MSQVLFSEYDWMAKVDDVIEFLGIKFYGIPCSAVEKDGDPFGRIVHDYGYYSRGSYFIKSRILQQQSPTPLSREPSKS